MLRRLALAGVAVLLAACPATLTGPPRPTASRPLGVAGSPALDAGLASGDAGPTDAAVSQFPPEMFAAGQRKKPTHPGDACEPADENIARAEKELASSARPRPAPVAGHLWDRKSPPAGLDRIASRFALTRAERSLLHKNGFVVASRLEQRSYAEAFHEIYQSELPIYVSVDAIFYAVFKSNDALIEKAETRLAERLEHVVTALRKALPRAKADYPDEVSQDLDLYLTVASSLLAGEKRPSLLGSDKQAALLIDEAEKSDGTLEKVSLFGRDRMIDFSQYQPRGHYSKSEELQHYFRGALWLSRLELNLVSRASRSSEPGVVPNPAETPREAVDALALADLSERAGALPDLDAVEQAFSLLAGRRDDVSVRDLLALAKRAKIKKLGIPDSADALRAAIGSGYARTARIHYMPQGSTPLPVIATLLGPRIGADAEALGHLVHAEVDGRDLAHAGDVAFLLGHDRAKKLIARDLAAYPSLDKELSAGRKKLANVRPDDLYSAWLAAIRELSSEPEGTLPSYMKRDAFRDLRINSTIAAYGELRHNYLLIAGESYSEGGCEIPDGFVEPAPAVYQALGAYAERGARATALLGDAEGEESFRRLGQVLATLRTIALDELAGRPLSQAAKNWLSMVVEIVPPSSDGPGSFDGWYFDLFPTLDDAFAEHTFIADWFTGSNTGKAVYAGATHPRLGVFVVDVGGAPRAFVGPVARAFEHVGPLSKRAKDADVASLGKLEDPWAGSYTATTPLAPALSLVPVTQTSGGGQVWAVRSASGARQVTLELLGHHREVIGSARATVGGGFTPVRVPPSRQGDDSPELVRVRAGEFSAEFSAWSFYFERTFGGARQLSDAAFEALATRLREAEDERAQAP
jgi:Protein of unknown function (DUF3160)